MFNDNIYDLPRVRLCQAPANKDLRVRRRAPVPVSLRLGSEPCDIRRMLIWMLVHDVYLQLLQPVASLWRHWHHGHGLQRALRWQRNLS